MNTFAEFGLLPSLLKTLKDQKITKPTEIQRNTIPLMMSGQSTVGVSETGSGKTLAYALPMLHLIKSLETEGRPVADTAAPRGIVIVPSRELGEQVSKVFKIFTHETRIRVRPALGGMEFEQARRNISGPFEILLATPGRLAQLMAKELIFLHDVRMVVFDEADQMLDKGFLEDSQAIVAACPVDTPLALFSATVSQNVQQIVTSFFTKAEVVRSSGSGKVVKNLITKNETVIDGIRWPIFEKLIKEKTVGGTIVFTNTREQCDKLAAEITQKGYQCLVYRGDMDKGERRTNLKKFRKGEVGLLISTDLAARGLDIDHVGRVINYHLPQQKENYLHRAGRTARAGRSGVVVNLVTERDLPLIADIEGRGQSPKDLKSRFLDKQGRRLHVPEALRKPKASKPTGSKKDSKLTSAPSTKTFKKTAKKVAPKFKPKPKPSEATMLRIHGKTKR